MLIVGRITRAHGLRGEVVVDLLGEESRLAPGTELHTGDGVLTVVSARPHQDRWVVAFAEVAGRDAADALCASEAVAAGQAGTFLATLATTTESIASRFPPGSTWRC